MGTQLNIKNPEVLRLVEELAAQTGVSKTEAIRIALIERQERLAADRKKRTERRHAALMSFLENEVWPNIPPELLGKGISKAEREEILGYGPHGFTDHGD